MSRSYKKTPFAGGKSKWHKEQANRSLRRVLKQDVEASFPNRSYRKHYDPWAICDWKEVGVSFNEHMANCWKKYAILKNRYPNEEIEKPNKIKEYSRWMRWYRRK